MDYKIFIEFNKEDNIVYIKDSIGFYGIKEIYGIAGKNEKIIKEEIFNSVNQMIDHYVKKCKEEKKDEAN